MNIDCKFIILGILFVLFLLYITNICKTTNKNSNKGGAIKNNNCTLDDIIKHNIKSSKWVYLNGVIYDLTIFRERNYFDVDNIFTNFDPTNIHTLANIIRFDDLQDLYIIFKSREDYNNYVEKTREITLEKFNNSEFNIPENTDGFIYNEFKTTSETPEADFNNFKNKFLISINQFKIGIICPLGLNI